MRNGRAKARHIEWSTVFLVIGLAFYWPLFRRNFFSAFFTMTPTHADLETVAHVAFFVGVVLVCLIALAMRSRLDRLFKSHAMPVVVALIIGCLSGLVMLGGDLFAPSLGWLMPVCSALSFVGVIALTFSWATVLPSKDTRTTMLYLVISFSLSYIASLPAYLFSSMAEVLPYIFPLISGVFCVVCMRRHAQQSTILREESLRQESFSQPSQIRNMVILLVVFLLVRSFIRGFIGSDALEVAGFEGEASLGTAAISFALSIVIAIVIHIVNRKELVFSVAWSILAVMLFAGFFVVAGLSQFEFATQITIILMAPAGVLLSLFLWIVLICMPEHKPETSVIVPSVIFILVEAASWFTSDFLTLLTENLLGFSLSDYVGLLSLLATLILIIAALVFFNALASPRITADENSAREENDGMSANERALQEIINQYQLTEREAEVLSLIAQGHSYKKVAEIMYVSQSTIQTHATNLYRKLGVHSKQEVIDLINKTAERY